MDYVDGGMNSQPELAGPMNIRAAWVFPIDSPPIRNGLVTIENQVIRAIGITEDGPVKELPETIILPALVNAHTHLEFSDLTEPLGEVGCRFTDWIRRVIQYRRDRDSDPEQSIRRRSFSVTAGLEESRRSCVGALGEIATTGWLADNYSSSDVDCTIFLELLGLSTAHSPRLLQAAEEHIRQSFCAPWRPGLSPHAPYTVHPSVLDFACRLSQSHRIPVAMHLAESFDELELLQSHSGHLVEMLAELGAWDPTAIPRGIRPLDFLKTLGNAHRGLIVHGNFLNSTEIHWMAEHGENLSVVYCPRTQAYFGHGEYPLQAMLDAGVRVALGTDSRGSNPDLNLMAEMAFIARAYPKISPELIVRMGTIHGAQALGIDRHFGTLWPGKRARLTYMSMSERPSQDPYADLVSAILYPKRPVT